MSYEGEARRKYNRARYHAIKNGTWTPQKLRPSIVWTAESRVEYDRIRVRHLTAGTWRKRTKDVLQGQAYRDHRSKLGRDWRLKQLADPVKAAKYREYHREYQKQYKARKKLNK
jgi:hypothetical protein